MGDRLRRRPITGATIAAFIAAAMLLPLVPKVAAYPGDNGPFVVALESCYGNSYLATLPWRGGSLTPITETCGPHTRDDESVPLFVSPEPQPGGQALFALSGGCQGLVRMDMDGTNRECLPSSEGAGEISFSPRGDQTVRAGGGTDLIFATANGSTVRTVTVPVRPPVPDRASAYVQNPRWSPDGKLIAVEVSVRGGQRPSPGVVTRSGIWLVRAADGKPVRRLTRAERTDAEWSPDGRYLVYRTPFRRGECCRGARRGNLYVVSRDGRSKRALVRRAKLAEVSPAWSPDGRHIAWISLDFSARDIDFDVYPSLWIRRVANGDPKLIRKLPRTFADEIWYFEPQLTWAAAPE